MPESQSNQHDTTKKKGRFARNLHMQAIPGYDFYLYSLMREQLHLKTMREVFICGLRLMYAIGHDQRLQQILLNVATDVRSSDLDQLIMTHSKAKLERPYSPMPLSVDLPASERFIPVKSVLPGQPGDVLSAPSATDPTAQ